MELKPEPTQPDEGKKEFWATLARIASEGNVRSSPLLNLTSLEGWGFSQSLVGGNPSISEQSAIRLTAVFSCLQVLGDTNGSLPCGVDKESDNGVIKAHNHPVHKIVSRRPNPFTTAFDFWKAMEILCRSWGNSYAYIERGIDMQPKNLWLMMPWHTQILKNGNPITNTAFDLTAGDSIYYMNNGTVIPATDVIHFKNFTYDGISGISTIRQNALTISQGLKLQQYNTTVINTKPPGYITMPGKPKDDQTKANVKAMWTKSEGGVENIGGVPLLYGGVEYKAFPLPAEDVAYIESLKGNKIDICSMFKVPPSLIQDYTSVTFNNAEQQDLIYVKHTVTPMVTPKEQELTDKLFPEANKTSLQPYVINFDVKYLLQGDLKAQQAWIEGMIMNGVLSPNEAREELGLPSFPGGDDHYIQMQYVPVDMVKQVLTAKKATPEKVTKEQKAKLKEKFNGSTESILDILNS